jgi:hypothetical protein
VVTLARPAGTAVDLGRDWGGRRRVSVEIVFIVIKFKCRVVIIAFVGCFVNRYRMWIIVKV